MLSSAAAHPPPPTFSFFSKPKTTSSVASSVVVTTRVVTVQRPAVTEKKPLASSAPPNPLPAVPEQPRTKPKTVSSKRKHGEKDATAGASASKRARTDAPTPPSTASSRSSSREPPSIRPSSSSASSSRASTRFHTSPPASDAIYSKSRSRSASVLPSSDESFARDCFVEENFHLEPDFLSCETVVKSLIKSYKTFFKNLDDPTDTSFEAHPTDYPVGELEFPNTGASERYILLVPKDKDHYNPIMDLERSLYTIIDAYLTPAQQALFGTTHTDLCPPTPDRDALEPRINHIRTFQRAVHRRDGPLFLATLSTINFLLRALKYPRLPDDLFEPLAPNALKTFVHNWTPTGLPQAVALRIVDETYQRVVGPRTHELARYEAFSSTVYGELMPSFVSDLVRLGRLRPGRLLVDLGAGVGNVVLQAALESGCDAFGVEIMHAPADIARAQRQQMRMRARMWGVRMGAVELEEGDMLASERVSALLGNADVVLINNKVFSESLNVAIRPKFLDLKEGALVISLQPFVASSRLTERNIDDVGAIFDVAEHAYRSGAVSWGSGAGTFYVHRVDREGYKAIRERFESQRARSSRARR